MTMLYETKAREFLVDTPPAPTNQLVSGLKCKGRKGRLAAAGLTTDLALVRASPAWPPGCSE